MFSLRTRACLTYALAFDVFENALVVWLIAHFPARHEALALALPVVTMVKRTAVMASLASLLAGLAIATSAKARRLVAPRRHEPPNAEIY